MMKCKPKNQYFRCVTVHKVTMAISKLSVSNDEDKCKIYERLGDLCCSIGANYRAIHFYEKAVSSVTLAFLI